MVGLDIKTEVTNGLVVYPKLASVAVQYPFIFFSVMMIGQYF